MRLNNEIEKMNSFETSQIKTSIQNLRNDIFVKDLKKDLQDFVRKEVNIDFEKDSLISNGFEHKRGDYGYYENTIFLNNKQQDISSFFLLHSRSQPRYYAQSSRGISLQNYLFNISKENEIDKLSKISMTFLYHKEDIYFAIF